jgi:hypothetical protein
MQVALEKSVTGFGLAIRHPAAAEEQRNLNSWKLLTFSSLYACFIGNRKCKDNDTKKFSFGIY